MWRRRMRRRRRRGRSRRSFWDKQGCFAAVLQLQSLQGALLGTGLYCTTTHSTAQHQTQMYNNTKMYNTTPNIVVLHSTVQYHIKVYNTILDCTTQHSTAQNQT